MSLLVAVFTEPGAGTLVAEMLSATFGPPPLGCEVLLSPSGTILSVLVASEDVDAAKRIIEQEGGRLFGEEPQPRPAVWPDPPAVRCVPADADLRRETRLLLATSYESMQSSRELLRRVASKLRERHPMLTIVARPSPDDLREILVLLPGRAA